MTIDLVLSPRDGLSLKDARGFDLAGGVTAAGLPWPGPATTAGAARAVIGRLQGLSETYGKDAHEWQSIVDQVAVWGPIVLDRPLDGARWSPRWPAPQDAVRLPHPKAGRRDQPEAELQWLKPHPRGTASWSVRGLWTDDDEEANATEGLWLPVPRQEGKPLRDRLLWSHEEMVKWLRDPRRRDEDESTQPAERVDIHLSVDPLTLAAKDEHLFAHSTYESLVRTARRDVREFGLGLRLTGVPDALDLTETMWRVGGEGRFASATLLPPEVLASEELAQHWQDSRFLRLILVTPAQFATGWRPDWLAPARANEGHQFEGRLPGLDRPVVLRAAFVDRAWWTSGWDLAQRRPKPSVACVAAGAVYYLESPAQPFTAHDIRSLWLSSIQQDRTAADGFGLVLPAAWPVTV